MLRNLHLHKDYQECLKLKLLDFYDIERSRLVSFDKSISKLYLLNLDNLLPVVKSLYPNLGRPAKNQQGIIRSLILMLELQEHSITKWAIRIKNDFLLFQICGFDSPNAPSVASYYDLLIRFWLISNPDRIKIKRSVKRFTPKPRKKLKANQKQPNKHSGIVKKLVNRAINGRLPDFRPEKVLQELLARCVINTSAEMGLLGNISELSIAFDGSPYYSGTRHYGVKTCDCRSKRIYNCSCPRRLSDPDTGWGWDSYREQWFFGDALFNVTASDSPNDLPIYIRMVQASRHDSVTTIFALRDIMSLYPAFKFKNFLADGAMDDYSIY